MTAPTTQALTLQRLRATLSSGNISAATRSFSGQPTTFRGLLTQQLAPAPTLASSSRGVINPLARGQAPTLARSIASANRMAAPNLSVSAPLDSQQWPTDLAAISGMIRPALQASTGEYATPEEARRWGGSSCAAAALTAVLRATGRALNVGNVVGMLERANGITVEQGLISRPALVATARANGLNAVDGPLSYDQLVAAARGGPVLVDVTNKQFPAGHWLVVTGADAGGVSLVDSSGYGLTRMSRADLVASWSGRGVRLAASSSPAATQTPNPSLEIANG